MCKAGVQLGAEVRGEVRVRAGVRGAGVRGAGLGCTAHRGRDPAAAAAGPGAKQLRAVKVKASTNRPAKPQTQNRKISIFLLIWSFNNNIFFKKESEIHQVPARELGFCGVCVYGGGRDGVVQTGKEGPWLEGFFGSLVSKEGERILSS